MTNPKQESKPVAWRVDRKEGSGWEWWLFALTASEADTSLARLLADEAQGRIVPLYAHPAPDVDVEALASELRAEAVSWAGEIASNQPTHAPLQPRLAIILYRHLHMEEPKP